MAAISEGMQTATNARGTTGNDVTTTVDVVVEEIAVAVETEEDAETEEDVATGEAVAIEADAQTIRLTRSPTTKTIESQHAFA